MEISIIVPVLNEADNIEATLSELEIYMNNYLGSGGWEIVVVDDGSMDDTVTILNKIKQTKSWLKSINLMSHYGRGRALRSGFEASLGDIVVSLDADLSYAPYHIQRLVEKMKEENADIVVASPYGKGGTFNNVPFKRLWISILGNKILSYMFGGNLTVLTCIVRAYKKKFLEQLDLHSDDKEIHLEILYKARILGGKIIEAPADLYWREQKLLKTKSNNKNKRRSTIKIRKTSSTHLFFALLNKPGFIFWVPGYALILVSLFILAVIARTVSLNVATGTPVYFAMRNSMITAIPSWLTMATSFILGIQFLTIGFLTNQNKRHYEEIYRTLNAIFTKVKEKKE